LYFLVMIVPQWVQFPPLRCPGSLGQLSRYIRRIFIWSENAFVSKLTPTSPAAWPGYQVKHNPWGSELARESVGTSAASSSGVKMPS
ncbi:hypothetical protein, partial [Pseudomonas sp. CFBP 13711]|uniref:hypothetical protein n=1 Tax=Pseudomonas sp. CFBP 13711 TaxID=2775310 RepID=UPI001A7F070F